MSLGGNPIVLGLARGGVVVGHEIARALDAALDVQVVRKLGAPGTEEFANRLPLERAIGVIYQPETELTSHYFQASLSHQFDEYVWLDRTKAVTPLRAQPAYQLDLPKS